MPNPATEDKTAGTFTKRAEIPPYKYALIVIKWTISGFNLKKILKIEINDHNSLIGLMLPRTNGT